MPTPTEMTVDCPACPGSFSMQRLVPLQSVKCPMCGNEWRIVLQDVPGARSDCYAVDLGGSA